MGFVFSGVLVVYNLDRLLGSKAADALNTSERSEFFAQNTNAIYFLIGISFLSAALFLILTSFVYIRLLFIYPERIFF